MKNLRYYFSIVFTVAFIFSAQAQWVQTGGPLGGHNIHFAKSTGGKLWASTPDGIQYSTNDGNTWLKAFPNVHVGNYVLTFGDTIFTIITDYTMYNPVLQSYTFAIVSYDNGISWPDTNDWYTLNVFLNLYNLEKTSTRVIDPYFGISADFGGTWLPIPTVTIGASITDMQAYKKYVAHNEDYFPNGHSVVSFDNYATLVYTGSSYPNKVIGVTDSIIFFENSSTAIRKLLRTTNLGASFDTVLTLPSGYDFGGCNSFHPNEDTILLVSKEIATGNNPIVYRSINKGITWQPMSNNFSAQRMNEYVKTASNEYLYEHFEEVRKFSEATDTFALFNNSIKGRNIQDLISANNSLYGVGLNFLFRSDDDGATWTNISPNAEYFSSSYATYGVDGDTVFVKCYDTLFYSYNKGNSWLFHIDATPANLAYYYLHQGTLYTLTDSFKFSTNFGISWNPITAGSLVNSTNRSFHVDKDTLFCIESNSNLYYHYLNTVTNTFDYLGNTLLATGYYTRENGIWFSYNSSTLQFCIDGANWFNCNTPGVTSSFVVWNRPVMVNGVYYCTLNWNELYFSANGIDWQKAVNLNMDMFTHNYLNVQKHNLTEHHGKLYNLSTFRSVWVLDDTLYGYQGTVYFDDNNNGIHDNGEAPVPNVVLSTPNYFVNSNTAGVYNLLCFSNNDTLIANLPQNYITNPSYHVIDNNSFSEKDFGVYCPISFKDNTVDLTNTAIFNPGFQTHLIATVKNNGSITDSPTLNITVDTNLTFVSSIPAPTAVIGNVYSYSLSSLEKFTTTTVDMIVTTNIGTTLLTPVLCLAQLDTLSDVSTADNHYILQDEVLGSFDPNDKNCKQGATFTTSQVENNEALEYTIRFQNTGIFPTSFVKILDTLSQKLDLSTFKFISTSHPVSLELNYNGIITFNFNPLALPDSGSNEAESHGFVKYSIEPKEDVQVGDVILNTASIYFDYNAPIVTNTTNTVITGPLYTSPVSDTFKPLKIYPNPTDKIAYLDLENSFSKNCRAGIYNLVGDEIAVLELKERITPVNTSTWNSGAYLVVVRNAENEIVLRGRLVVINK